jgi:hypothetical protein
MREPVTAGWLKTAWEKEKGRRDERAATERV